MRNVFITKPFNESLKNYLLNLLTVNNSQQHIRGKEILEQAIALYFWNLKGTLLYDLSGLFSTRAYILVSSLPFLIYAAIKLKRRFISFMLAVVISVSLSDLICYRVLKPAIGRPRPKIELNIAGRTEPLQKKDYSMPSNHASNIFAFSIVYILFVRKFWLLLLCNATIVSFSRIVLVKHYPTDILAGIAVGSALGIITVIIIHQAERIRGS
jgi:undecaprenyl-diphosphatase